MQTEQEWETTMVLSRQAQRPYTAEDLLHMPDDGQRYEVIGGELIVSPSPSVLAAPVRIAINSALCFRRLSNSSLVTFDAG